MTAPALRVMTYNIRNGRGSDGRVDLARIADVIAGYAPDVVALQEVDACRPRSGGLDQANEIAARLGLAAHFCPCVEQGDERYGIATLSRLPVIEAITVDLPRRGKHPRSEPRRVLITRLQWPGSEAPIAVVNTHLSVLRAERAEQLAALAGVLGDGDVVLAGDLNCGARGAVACVLGGGLRAATGGARTWPARLPLVQLDHVLYRGALRLVAGGAWTRGPARRASDHLPVVAQFEPMERVAS